MISVKIKGANTVYGTPDDWDKANGECANLYVRKEESGDTTLLLSAWKPTALELEMLQGGGSLVLGLISTGHPPVLMYVSGED